MNIIISVAINKVNEIEIGGVIYEVNDSFRKLCKTIFRIYAVMIGVLCVVGINVAFALNISDWFTATLFVLIILVGYNLIINYTVNRFVIKRINKR